MAAALSSELRRQSDAVREVTARRLDDLLALIDEMARNDGLQVSAPAALALMVGAVSLSRIPKDAARAESYLAAARLLLSQVATPSDP